MKKTIALVALSLAVSLPAFAAKNKDKGFAFVGAGLTGGGKTLPTVDNSDGTSSSMKSGGLVALYGGYEYRFGFGLTVQGNIGYHYHKKTAAGGDLAFKRYPLEMLVYYDLAERFRMGGGLRYVMNPRLSGDGTPAARDVRFDNAPGVVLEAEYFYVPSASVKVRAVTERYKVQDTSTSVTSTHGGIYANYYF